MKALILAAGYATRLYPLTKEYPKPLLTVRQRPIINYILDKLEIINAIDEIIIITNSKFISRFRRWLKGLNYRKRISLVDDLSKTQRDRRGAIGDMQFAIDKKGINDDLLVIGGDNLFDGGLGDFLAFAKTHKTHPLIGAYNLKDINEAKNYGVLKLNKRKQIVYFKEKPHKPQSTLVAMCLYYFPKKGLGLIKEYMDNQRTKSDATGFYINWLTKRLTVYGFVFAGKWYDIGGYKFYNRAKGNFVP